MHWSMVSNTREIMGEWTYIILPIAAILLIGAIAKVIRMRMRNPDLEAYMASRRYVADVREIRKRHNITTPSTRRRDVYARRFPKPAGQPRRLRPRH